MQDFDSVSASSTDPSALVEQLAEKSKDGWNVIAIVPTGGNVTAFLSKSTGGAAAPAKQAEEDKEAPKPEEAKPAETSPTLSGPGSSAAAASPAAVSAPEPVKEPSGWGSAPTTSAPTPSAPAASAPAASTPSFQPANTAPSVVAPAAPAAATPSIPAGWYADPAGRFELRYWDGKAWTEHVSRGGQQSTDPPTR